MTAPRLLSVRVACTRMHTVSGSGRRRWRMIHNWGRFGGHKTTRKWVRTLITGHIFRSAPRRPTERPSDPHYGAQTYGARSGQLLPRRAGAGNKLGDAIAEPLRRKAKVLYSYLNGLTYAPTRHSSGPFLLPKS